MKKKKVIMLVANLSLVFVLVALSFRVAFAGSPQTPTPIVLKSVYLLRLGHPTNYALDWISEQIKVRSKGELAVKITGGPETIPTREQTNAALRDVIQIYMPGSGYVQGVWPEAAFLPLSRLTPTQERKLGAFSLLQESAMKRGLYYLGRSAWPRAHYLFLNKPVKCLKDLRGVKVRSGALAVPFCKALGMSPVRLPFREVYTGMQRGVIEGYTWPSSICDYSLEEVTKYMINHHFHGANIVVMVRLDTWKQLPSHLQALLAEIVEEQEVKLEQRWRNMWEKEKSQIKAGGVQFIQFTESEARQYVELAFSTGWEKNLEKSPTYGPKLRKIMFPKH